MPGLICLIGVFLADCCVFAQTIIQLPKPTGTYAIGRVSLVFEDPSRLEPLDPNVRPSRIMVDVWYPAEITSDKPSADYLNTEVFEQILSPQGLKNKLGVAHQKIKDGLVQTHAVSGAHFVHSLKQAPLLIFSPGGGMIRELYTFQLEDLASHGFIVAALTHSYDGFLTVFPDGSHVQHDRRRWPGIPSVEGEANLNQLEWHTADILFVLNGLIDLNSSAEAGIPFHRRLDVHRIGVFGHSFGGVAAAHSCQKDQRIRACLNQDGAMGMKPFYLDERGWGMNQAFMLLERPPNREPLTDQDLSEMKLSRERANKLIERLNNNRNSILSRIGKGSYRVLLQRKETTHMDFSDLMFLGAASEEEIQKRTQIITVIRGYTRAFFDQYVRGRKSSLLSEKPNHSLIEAVEKFKPGRR